MGHSVDLVAVAGNFFVEDARPDERIKFVLELVSGCTVDKKVEIEVATNSIQVIFNVF